MAYSACLVPPGSENMANDHEGSPGTWETLPSPSKGRPETRLTNSRWIHGPVSWAVGDERGTQRWYRQAKETKCGEMGGRESQHLIVPLKRGNQPEGPRRGKEVPSHEPLKGNMPGTLRPEPCPRNDDGSRGSRIHEMRNRVRVMCKPGSEGGRVGQPPRSTRPLLPAFVPEDPGAGRAPEGVVRGDRAAGLGGLFRPGCALLLPAAPPPPGMGLGPRGQGGCSGEGAVAVRQTRSVRQGIRSSRLPSDE